MNSQRRRLKKIEVSLTPDQVVRPWMKNALPGTFEDAAGQYPRIAITDSIVRIFREGMKPEPETVVERAILQASREADWLYLIAFLTNHIVQEQFDASKREYLLDDIYDGHPLPNIVLRVSELIVWSTWRRIHEINGKFLCSTQRKNLSTSSRNMCPILIGTQCDILGCSRHAAKHEPGLPSFCC